MYIRLIRLSNGDEISKSRLEYVFVMIHKVSAITRCVVIMRTRLDAAYAETLGSFCLRVAYTSQGRPSDHLWKFRRTTELFSRTRNANNRKFAFDKIYVHGCILRCTVSVWRLCPSRMDRHRSSQPQRAPTTFVDKVSYRQTNHRWWDNKTEIPKNPKKDTYD